MSESLKDQLLALGLAPKKKQHKPAKRKRSVSKSPGSNATGNGSAIPDISLDQAYRIRNREVQRQKLQAADRKRESERQRKLVNQKLKTLISEYSQRDEAADCKRNFIYKGRIRSVLATAAQVRAINEGVLGVVYLSGNYHLLPSDKVKEVLYYAPDHVPDLQGAETESEDENPVPDDLIW